MKVAIAAFPLFRIHLFMHLDTTESGLHLENGGGGGGGGGGKGNECRRK